MRVLSPLLLLFAGLSVVLVALALLMLLLGSLSPAQSLSTTAPFMSLDLVPKIQASQDISTLKSACILIVDSYRAEVTSRQGQAEEYATTIRGLFLAIAIWGTLSATILLWAYLLMRRVIRKENAL